MHKLDPLYKSYHIKNSSAVIWGHRGQKVIFTKNVSTQTDYVALTLGWFDFAKIGKSINRRIKSIETD